MVVFIICKIDGLLREAFLGNLTKARNCFLCNTVFKNRGQPESGTSTSKFQNKINNVDDVTVTSQLMVSYRKINITREKIIDYRVTSPSNHCCQINIIVQERPGISVIMHLFLFLRRQFDPRPPTVFRKMYLLKRG